MGVDRGFSEGLRTFFQQCIDEYDYLPTFAECVTNNNKKNKYFQRIVNIIPDLEYFDSNETKTFRYVFTEVKRKFKQKLNRERRKEISGWSSIRKTPNKKAVHQKMAKSLTGEEVDLDKKGNIVFDLGRIVPEFGGIKQIVKIKQPTGDVAKRKLVEALQLKQYAVNNEQLDTEFEYQKLKRDKMKVEVESMKVNKKADVLYDKLLDTVENFMKDLQAPNIKSEALSSVTKNEADTLLKVSQILKKK